MEFGATIFRARGHGPRAERGEFPTSITPWPAAFSLSPQDAHLVRFGVFLHVRTVPLVLFDRGFEVSVPRRGEEMGNR